MHARVTMRNTVGVANWLVRGDSAWKAWHGHSIHQHQLALYEADWREVRKLGTIDY